MFYPASVWDPQLILSQLVVLLCSFYLLEGFLIFSLRLFLQPGLETRYLFAKTLFDPSLFEDASWFGWFHFLGYILLSVPM